MFTHTYVFSFLLREFGLFKLVFYFLSSNNYLMCSKKEGKISTFCPATTLSHVFKEGRQDLSHFIMVQY